MDTQQNDPLTVYEKGVNWDKNNKKKVRIQGLKLLMVIIILQKYL